MVDLKSVEQPKQSEMTHLEREWRGGAASSDRRQPAGSPHSQPADPRRPNDVKVRLPYSRTPPSPGIFPALALVYKLYLVDCINVTLKCSIRYHWKLAHARRPMTPGATDWKMRQSGQPVFQYFKRPKK